VVSVTQRIRQVKQPRFGYVNPHLMYVTYMSGNAPAPLDHAVENVHASLVSMAVDYLTRWCLDYEKQPHEPSAEYVFTISCAGASKIDRALGTNHAERAVELCRLIDESRDFNTETPSPPKAATIAAAIELVSFEVGFRGGVQAYNPDAKTTPDPITIDHIATMVSRSLAFFQKYGPVVVDGFTMLGGYTETVDSGDGDFITADTLWDFKVSVRPPTTAHTLQLLMYWLMARQSDWNWKPTWNFDHRLTESEWREMWDLDEYLRKNRCWPDDLRGPAPTHIGIYNPRLDTAYRMAVSSIPAENIEAVSRDVIGQD
jgi:hypothetical protein